MKITKMADLEKVKTAINALLAPEGGPFAHYQILERPKPCLEFD